jgi:multidrug transporter EmrE-like cation transporter
MSEKTPVLSIVMFFAAALLGALGAYLYKSGAESVTGPWHSYLLNIRILAGLCCYAAVMVLFVTAFRIGGTLTVLYPVYASTFIFGAVISWYAYGTPIKITNIIGMMLLLAGMYLMGRQ